MSEVEETAKKLLAPGKGILAADESGGSIHKKFEQLNILDDEAHRRDYRNILIGTPELERYVERQLLTEVQLFITEWIKQKINGCYVGPFGVDMMVVGEEDSVSGELKYYLHPCVEINLRRTMGHVALSISPKEEGLCKTMRVSYEGGSYHLRIANNHEILV